MRTFITLIIFFASALPVFAQHNFRDTKWGMTAEQVRKVEKAKFNTQKGDDLFYDIELFDARCLITYSFVNNKLFRAGYATDEYFMNEAMYFDKYEEFRSVLVEKYGEPKKEVRYVPETYKDDPGSGLLAGIVFYYAHWDLGDIEILLSVEGGNTSAHVTVEYTNKELKLVSDRKGKGNIEEKF